MKERDRDTESRADVKRGRGWYKEIQYGEEEIASQKNDGIRGKIHTEMRYREVYETRDMGRKKLHRKGEGEKEIEEIPKGNIRVRGWNAEWEAKQIDRGSWKHKWQENTEVLGDREKSYEKKGDQTRERKGNLQSGSQTGDQERERY
jgi:hypothetical protein